MTGDSGSDFMKRLDDLVRQELSILGHDYPAIIAGIEAARTGGAIIRFHPPYEDIVIDEPEPDLPEDAFAARVRRRLRIVLEAPERPPAPPESV